MYTHYILVSDTVWREIFRNYTLFNTYYTFLHLIFPLLLFWLSCLFFAPAAPYFFLLYSAEWLLCYRLVYQYCSDPYQLPLFNGLGHNWWTSRYLNTQQYCTLFFKTGPLIEFTHHKKENIIVFKHYCFLINFVLISKAD